MALGTALSVGLVGLKAFVIQLQAFISPGLPFFSIIGLPDASLSEARERVKSACTASGFKWPQTRVTVNMSPASMPKRGSSHDLAIAASVLSASEFIEPDALDNTVLLGELNLDGTVLPINGLLPIMLHMKEHGMNRVVVPRANRDEAELVDGLDVMYVSHLGELIELFGGRANYTVHEIHVDARRRDLPEGNLLPVGDMNEVVGQHDAKEALKIAAAGGHHVLMTGPPGMGKPCSPHASRRYCPAEPTTAIRSGIHSLALRSAGHPRHRQHATIRGSAPHRLRRLIGGRRHRSGRTGIGDTRPPWGAVPRRGA